MTLARQRVLMISSTEVRASDLEYGGSWVRIPSGLRFFLCPLTVDSLYVPLFHDVSLKNRLILYEK